MTTSGMHRGSIEGRHLVIHCNNMFLLIHCNNMFLLIHCNNMLLHECIVIADKLFMCFCMQFVAVGYMVHILPFLI